MNYYSQAGQDKWIEELLVKGEGLTEGNFLDIGCGGKQWSNTLGLEAIGWVGILLDNSIEAREYCVANRRNPFILHDATTVNWEGILPPLVDYLSLDVDGASLEVLISLPLERVEFRAITIEHDAYRFGDKLRSVERQVLRNHGYTLWKGNVEHDGMPFEDWWIKPELLKLKDKQNGRT